MIYSIGRRCWCCFWSLTASRELEFSEIEIETGISLSAVGMHISFPLFQGEHRQQHPLCTQQAKGPRFIPQPHWHTLSLMFAKWSYPYSSSTAGLVSHTSPALSCLTLAHPAVVCVTSSIPWQRKRKRRQLSVSSVCFMFQSWVFTLSKYIG